MKTRITEALGIEHPILLSGMSWISVPELVAADISALAYQCGGFDYVRSDYKIF